MMSENILTGSFIYALGILSGKQSPDTDIRGSLNFFQQSKQDTRYGDLLANWGSKMFIIEFKKAEKDFHTELQKPVKAALVKGLTADNAMKEISENCHFIAYAHYNLIGVKDYSCDICFKSYHAALTGTKTGRLEMHEFIQRLSDPQGQYGQISNEKFKIYLEYLRKNYEASEKEKGTSGAKARSISGLVTAVSKEGRVIQIPFFSYSQLLELMSQTYNIALQFQQQVSHQQQIEMHVETEISPKRDKGYGFKM